MSRVNDQNASAVFYRAPPGVRAIAGFGASATGRGDPGQGRELALASLDNDADTGSRCSAVRGRVSGRPRERQ